MCKGFAWFNDPTPDDGDNNCYLKNIPAVILLDVAKQCPYHPVVDFYVKDGLIKDPPAPPPPPFPPPSPSPLPPPAAALAAAALATWSGGPPAAAVGRL